MTIGIVVAALCPSDLIPGEQHRHTERQQKGGQQVALLAVAQGDDLRIIGRPLHTVIAAIVGVGPVAVILAIRLVVLSAVADEVLQCKSVMSGNEIDARPRPPASISEDIRGAGHP